MTTRLTWTKEEDAFLRKIFAKQEKTNWNNIMQLINSQFPTKIRSAKQCRERYINYSSFNEATVSISDWKSTDLDILYSEFAKFGPRWTKIAQYLPEKSQNAIKNKFYGSLRKVIRKINMIGKASKIKIKKNIRYESVARIIEASESFLTLSQELKHESHQLRQKILKLMRVDVLDSAQEETYQLINRINKFNLATRSYRPTKIKRTSQRDDASLRRSEDEKDNSGMGEEETDNNTKKIFCTSYSVGMSTGDCYNEEMNNQKEIDKQNGYKTSFKIKDYPCSTLEFPPFLNFSQCSSKIQAQEQFDRYFLELFPERESPLEGWELI